MILGSDIKTQKTIVLTGVTVVTAVTVVAVVTLLCWAEQKDKRLLFSGSYVAQHGSAISFLA